MTRIRKFIKKPLVVIGIIIIFIIGIIIFFAVKKGSSPKYDFVIAKKQNVVQIVSVTGQVKPSESVDLSFERSGAIAKVYSNIGDNVNAGQVLVSLRNADVSALLKQAKAQEAAEKALLEKLQQNSGSEQSLLNSYNSVVDTITKAFSNAEDAVRSKTIGMFTGYKTYGYQLTFNPCDSQLADNTDSLHVDAEFALDAWKKEINSLTSSSSRDELDAALVSSKKNLSIVRSFINSVNSVLLTKCSIENSSLEAYRANILAADASVSTAISNINTLQQSIDSQKVAANNSEAVAAQVAKLKAAKANVERNLAEFEKTILRSPMTGIVTRQDARVGEVIQAGKPITSVISNATFKIEANIPEADIAKVEIGDTASITLDAYGSDVVFATNVAFIDPAETVIEGVSTYKTTLLFTKEDVRIKPGMTANIDILTAEKDNVVAIPQRAVISDKGEKNVKVLNESGDIAIKSVDVGLRGSDGIIEIVKGINVGDKVITFTP